MPTRTTIAALAAAALLLAPAATHGQTSTTTTGTTVKGTVFAKRLAERLTTTFRITATSVKCNTTVRYAPGSISRCKARFATGDATTIRVRFTSTKGGFVAAPLGLLLRDIEYRIAEDLVTKQGAIADFTCPFRRAVKAGDRFPCYGTEAAGDGTTSDTGRQGYIYDVTQLGSGRVTFTLRA
ncbi:DUF4333 domain-containing protein [Conexibacter sp. W3-3-2]|uniref:DUF4333 domain-containing protein n=1 Tax=Conexibacter sp. W3-3-2 TaxID=2675227 RepID=UPI0012B8495C|nr:DUF4333 domain-containing protein [Conexibacter sp. W3-3-2]MTD43526.1 DUF4333 domain-containing protein [Conexibacter sp. W3-3-2]